MSNNYKINLYKKNKFLNSIIKDVFPNKSLEENKFSIVIQSYIKNIFSKKNIIEIIKENKIEKITLFPYY